MLCHEWIGAGIRRVSGGRIPRKGLRFDTRAPGVSDRTRAQIFWGIYESAEVRFVENYFRTGLDVVELGSSLGVVSCHIARRLEPTRRMVCVEANPDLMAVLERNLKSAAPGISATLLNRAIDYDASRETADLALSVSTSSSRLASGRHETGNVRTVATTTLSKILNEHDLGSFVLVSDIEGAEAGIVLHDTAALERCQQILIELHDVAGPFGTLDVEQLARSIQALGFVARAHYGPVYVFERPSSS